MRIALDPELRQRYAEAIRTGNFDSLAEINGSLLGGMSQLSIQELERVLEEGLMIESPIYKDGELVGYMHRTNPRAEPLAKFIEMLGATGSQQAITPKASGERKRDEGVGGLLEIYKRRTALAGAKAVTP